MYTIVYIEKVRDNSSMLVNVDVFFGEGKRKELSVNLGKTCLRGYSNIFLEMSILLLEKIWFSIVFESENF